MRVVLVCWSLFAFVASDISASPRRDPIEEVREILTERMGTSVALEHTNDATALQGNARSLLTEELTVERAVQVALLNNRGLQATLRELGMSQAEFDQALLLKNPVVHGEVRFPGRPLEIGLSQDVTDVFLRPLRKRVAAAHVRKARLSVAQSVLDLAAVVRSAFYSLQAATQALAMSAEIAEASRASAELAQRQHLAGNTSALTLESSEAIYDEARLDLAQRKVETVAAREQLNRLMGGVGAEADWRVAHHLPDLPEQEPSVEGMESLALTSRLDLAASEAEALAGREGVPLARSGRWPSLSLGVHLEREPEGNRTIGPSLEISLPLFDRGQAVTAGARARLEQSLDRRAALEVDVRSDVRSAHAHLSAAREKLLYYRDVVIPRRERSVAETPREYNFMLVGVYQLVQAKREEIQARSAHIEAQRDYWLARTELEHAVGGRLDNDKVPQAMGEPTEVVP